MSGDALLCFEYLNNNLSKWIESLAQIEKKIEERQREISVVPVPVMVHRKKNGSTESLRPQDEHDNNNHVLPDVIMAQTDDLPGLVGNVMGGKRKRKTASIASGHASLISRYRTRSMIIVYYDSEVQKRFEDVVRNIGTGRNYIRKGKMAARMEAMTAMSASDDDDSDDGQEDEGLDGQPVISKVAYKPRMMLPPLRTTRLRGFGGAAGEADETQIYDKTDKALDKAQALCERAAHQFLRDGDCQVEIDGAKEAFEEVRTLSEREYSRLKAKEAVSPPKLTSRPSPSEVRRPESKSLPGPMAIEIDDEEDESDDMQMPSLPLPRLRMTSAR